MLDWRCFLSVINLFFAVAKKEEKEVKKEGENNKEEAKAPEKRWLVIVELTHL